jgi:hypothetical protein
MLNAFLGICAAVKLQMAMASILGSGSTFLVAINWLLLIVVICLALSIARLDL